MSSKYRQPGNRAGSATSRIRPALTAVLLAVAVVVVLAVSEIFSGIPVAITIGLMIVLLATAGVFLGIAMQASKDKTPRDDRWLPSSDGAS